MHHHTCMLKCMHAYESSIKDRVKQSRIDFYQFHQILNNRTFSVAKNLQVLSSTGLTQEFSVSHPEICMHVFDLNKSTLAIITLFALDQKVLIFNAGYCKVSDILGD